MAITVLFAGSRSVTVQLGEDGLYELPQPAALRLNGRDAGTARTVVTSLYDLEPETDYTLEAGLPGGTAVCSFRTADELCTLDVRRFGAVGDGTHEDTAAIQAAIMACPRHGRVLIPAGTYRVLPLFLKSGIRLELARDAVLRLETDRNLFPVLPGKLPAANAAGEVQYGTWEGDPQDAYASLITGIGAEDCILYGQGTLDGNAAAGDWWVNAKVRRGAWRGNLLFLNGCGSITVQGLSFRNSPSWNLHPYFSHDLRFLNIHVEAPASSPNTDGFDPESCSNTLVAGAHFSVGDDCIAVKSGKLYMGSKYKTPNRDMEISHCLMENGHGGVTVGSEMAGGITGLTVHDCVMRHTDRGLRVKTRRGRGRDGVIDGILFERVRMEQVRTPLVVNSLYFCDPDGHSDYVQCTGPLPVDERTPRVGTLTFREIDADGASCAGYFLGLPEKPIEHIVLEHVRLRCAQDAPEMQPAMADCVGKMTHTGVVLRHVAKITMTDTEITGCEGDVLTCEDVGEVIRN